MKTVDYFIRCARYNLCMNPAMESSARLALEDANKIANIGDYDSALSRAIKSLSYSVGIFNKDYKDAINYQQQRGEYHAN